MNPGGPAVAGPIAEARNLEGGELGPERRNQPGRQAQSRLQAEADDVPHPQPLPGFFRSLEPVRADEDGVDGADRASGDRGEAVETGRPQGLPASDMVRAFGAAPGEHEADAAGPELLQNHPPRLITRPHPARHTRRPAEATTAG